jgi:hypothetical protein
MAPLLAENIAPHQKKMQRIRKKYSFSSHSVMVEKPEALMVDVSRTKFHP